jgi:hypothetical protein
MCAFWSSVTLMTGRYHGTPMARHAPLPIDADHFDRWLTGARRSGRRPARWRRGPVSEFGSVGFSKGPL